MNAFAYDIDYNEHNLPEKIYDSGDTEYKIFYGTDQQRKKTELSYSNNVVETKYYLGAYEKEITDEGTRELNYVPTPNGISAVYIQTLSGAEMYYIHTDYLGSIAAISRSDRTSVQDYYYTAWGKRQILNNNTGSTDFFIDRGYTGHQHLTFPLVGGTEGGLINMNARLYDPQLGRMLSPDNYVQNISNTQNFNRYSYVLNNPLKYTDPSGDLITPNYSQINYQISVNVFKSASKGSIYGTAMVMPFVASAGLGTSMNPILFNTLIGAYNNVLRTGISTNWDFKATLFAGIKGAASGAAGSTIGNAFGGIPGVFFGNMAKYTVNWGMDNLLNLATYQETTPYNLGEAVISSALSTSFYVGNSYLKWHYGLNRSWAGNPLKFKSYLTMTGDYQRSRFWQKEYGGFLLNDGSITRFESFRRHNLQLDLEDIVVPNNAHGVWHTHWSWGKTYDIDNSTGDILRTYTDIYNAGSNWREVTTQWQLSQADIRGINQLNLTNITAISKITSNFNNNTLQYTYGNFFQQYYYFF